MPFSRLLIDPKAYTTVIKLTSKTTYFCCSVGACSKSRSVRDHCVAAASGAILTALYAVL